MASEEIDFSPLNLCGSFVFRQRYKILIRLISASFLSGAIRKVSLKVFISRTHSCRSASFPSSVCAIPQGRSSVGSLGKEEITSCKGKDCHHLFVPQGKWICKPFPLKRPKRQQSVITWPRKHESCRCSCADACSPVQRLSKLPEKLTFFLSQAVLEEQLGSMCMSVRGTLVLCRRRARCLLCSKNKEFSVLIYTL